MGWIFFFMKSEGFGRALGPYDTRHTGIGTLHQAWPHRKSQSREANGIGTARHFSTDDPLVISQVAALVTRASHHALACQPAAGALLSLLVDGTLVAARAT